MTTATDEQIRLAKEVLRTEAEWRSASEPLGRLGGAALAAGENTPEWSACDAAQATFRAAHDAMRAAKNALRNACGLRSLDPGEIEAVANVRADLDALRLERAALRVAEVETAWTQPLTAEDIAAADAERMRVYQAAASGQR